MPYPFINVGKIKLLPFEHRKSKLYINDILVDPHRTTITGCPGDPEHMRLLAEKIVQARKANRPVILCCGAHLIKNGLQTIVLELMRDGWITHFATNGAGLIHDMEFGIYGQSTECVETYLTNGQFGLWRETHQDFHAILSSCTPNKDSGIIEGLGERAGEYIFDNMLKRDWSIFAHAHQMKIPATCHVSIGQDITHTKLGVIKARLLGAATHMDFLIFAEAVRHLEGGVYLSVGSSVMSPMIFEKALSIARNIEHQQNRSIQDFTIAVNDLVPQTWDWSKGEPPMNNPAYYHRFMKTFSRSHGRLFYFGCDNRKFLHYLWHLLNV